MVESETDSPSPFGPLRCACASRASDMVLLTSDEDFDVDDEASEHLWGSDCVLEKTNGDGREAVEAPGVGRLKPRGPGEQAVCAWMTRRLGRPHRPLACFAARGPRA